MDESTKKPLPNARVNVDDREEVYVVSDELGYFQLKTGQNELVLVITAVEYETKLIPLKLVNTSLDLGVIYLNRDITLEKTDNLISLTESDLDDESSMGTMGILQATKDVFFK